MSLPPPRVQQRGESCASWKRISLLLFVAVADVFVNERGRDTRRRLDHEPVLCVGSRVVSIAGSDCSLVECERGVLDDVPRN